MPMMIIACLAPVLSWAFVIDLLDLGLSGNYIFLIAFLLSIFSCLVFFDGIEQSKKLWIAVLIGAIGAAYFAVVGGALNLGDSPIILETPPSSFGVFLYWVACSLSVGMTSAALANILPNILHARSPVVRVDNHTQAKPEAVYTAPPKKKNENALNELKAMIGLDSVKEQVQQIRAKIIFDENRRKAGAKVTTQSYHMVFTGSSGTGKTTIARLLAQIFNDLGVLRKGHFIEANRNDLIGQHWGSGSAKTAETIDKAIDGILFIDEAYSIILDGKSAHGDPLGHEAITALLAGMENHRSRLIVIIAGYTKEMDEFLNSNLGLKSRFKSFIEFPDYTANEMLHIFEKITSDQDFELTNLARSALLNHLENLYMNRGVNFGNGRHVRNLFEHCITNQAVRLQEAQSPDLDTLSTIIKDDVNYAMRQK